MEYSTFAGSFSNFESINLARMATQNDTKQKTREQESADTQQEANNLLEKLGELAGYVQVYANDRIELVKLEAAEKSAKAVSAGITVVVLALLFTMALLFGSVALGLFIAEWVDSYAYAFLIIFGLYVLLGSIIAIFKKALVTNPVLTMIIKSIYK